ncbi:MAG: ubiquinol-cytochrome c reductase iron-sulfur subunit [Armatimonadetes bacterium]|nr:ubiquinol-cytochrome c reductase iron-sulfur subunit [Armatimonadota bacterium]MDW8121809.1 ubiquinol-cytochrome c reductase iron-sulfur subunit [Armatimonadota bacterium]
MAVQTAPSRTPARATGAARRKFLVDIFSALAWAVFWAIMAIFGWIFARFFFPNVLFEPPPTFKAGRPSDYPLGTVDGRWKIKYNVWIVHAPYGFFALSGTCTHLGCKFNWIEVEQKFKCPCHGSGFRMDGTNFEGPAPRPLDRHRITLAEDGQLLVDTSVVYAGEPGKNSNERWPESILRI